MIFNINYNNLTQHQLDMIRLLISEYLSVKIADTLIGRLKILTVCYCFDYLLAYEHKNKAILKVC